jgi:hypothetical protein
VVAGRGGWDPADQEALDGALGGAAASVAARVRGPRVLCLGTEELMYVPLRAAEALAAAAPALEVRYQSTTRSPIVAADVEGYPVRHARVFTHPGDPGRPSFVYNVPAGAYDDVVVFVEGATAVASELADLRAGLADAGAHLLVVALDPVPAVAVGAGALR